MIDFVALVSEDLVDLCNPSKAKQMQAYMKNKFSFYGITSPERKEYFRHIWQEHKSYLKDDFRNVVEQMWQKEEREYQYLAMEILRKVEKLLHPKDIAWLESLVIRNSWWDTVDFLAPNPIGAIFKNDKSVRDEYVAQWNQSDNFWLVRAAILFQLKYRSDVDHHLLFRLIDDHKHEKEFFIRKAAGWALRQLAKYKPELVKEYVHNTEGLSNLTIREALKHLH